MRLVILALCAAGVMAGQKSADTPSATSAPAATSASPFGAISDGASKVVSLLASLDRYDRDGRNPAQKIGFELPERAVNDYLAYALKVRPRPGLRGVTLKLLANNEVAVTAQVQPDVFLAWSAGLLAEDVRPKISDIRELRLNIVFEVDGRGMATFKINRGQAGSQPFDNQIISILLQALASHQPEKLDLSAPIPLPFGLKRLWTQAGLLAGTT